MGLNNYKGALLGLAIGDALGATTENMWIQDIKRQYGKLTEIIGGGWLHLEPGEITDDTGMTIAVAKGILRDPKSPDPIPNIGIEFIKWRNSIPKDIGNTTRMALTIYDRCRKWSKAAELAHRYAKGNSAGNGSLMRCLPVALAYPKTAHTMEYVTYAQSKMTHWDSEASEACMIYNRAACRIIAGETLTDALRAEIKDARPEYKYMTRRNPQNRPSGYVVDTFAWVIRVLLTSETYEEVVVRLANMGSDSDSTAAIAGGLAGLYYGLEAIPERFSSKILLREEILQLAEQLYDKAEK